MGSPARPKWWDDVVAVDATTLNKFTTLLWGDRVRRLGPAVDGKVPVSARGTSGLVPESVLGGEPLLELYFIDVGQGDGVLVVTPEGHHVLIDGGNPRSRQQTGKSAADFVDWKFCRDYLSDDERDDAANRSVSIDAMLASHADRDHYGGLSDLLDPETEEKQNELEATSVSVEAFYHPGLSPQHDGTDGLGEKAGDHFVRLLSGRESAKKAVSDNPGEEPRLRGQWKSFVQSVIGARRAVGGPTRIKRVSHRTGFLPGFDGESSAVTVRVLAPILEDAGGKDGLRDLGDEGQNKNGHSVALRLDYRDRSFLLGGDLNDRSQRHIMAHYGESFASRWRVDVAKACHHGSHHVDFEFLQGVGALSTVFSSGDANTFDHPRAWVLGAAALSGRVIRDKKRARLRAPLVYSTEVARSIALKEVEQLRRYRSAQPFRFERGDPEEQVSGAVATSKWRLVLDATRPASKIRAGKDAPPVPAARVMRGVVYGLVNVRTDGKRLLFAVRNEGNHKWSSEILEPDEIEAAFQVALSA